MKPGNRSLYLRIDCLDWLASYAADEQHFQGIEREEPASLQETAVANYRVEWGFNNDEPGATPIRWFFFFLTLALASLCFDVLVKES